uniref:NADH-ubiquinone oxidoreductase chain 5 n=1 Tax=Paroedura picta TaxID=143630 RepID=A0A0U2KRB1_9SAUR|nr:NADH dehydrogenase subunit 5 [Paroedura picta]ALF04026.1 NADH dehydrogenase subunit 5 [Paroedura picta]
MAHQLLNATLLLTLLVLILPLFVRKLGHMDGIVAMVKLATLLSLIPLAIFIYIGAETVTSTVTWTNLDFDLEIKMVLDIYLLLFLPVGLYITWSILEFARPYMETDPHKTTFFMYLLLFITSMIILVSSSNLVQLFVGWEGVGIMSFLLINWWGARADASSAALQAVIYNRIGDMGFIMVMAWLAMELNTLNMQQILLHPQMMAMLLMGLILAAAGKSAQVGLHPWLPAAMEGPTPVSALLHSSTMVVAGIFLLIRFYPLLEPSTMAKTVCLFLGGVTTTLASMCALTQNDIKKIIAFSTSSQLGLMMMSLGLGQPELTFLHILTHAFFKAMLFLCSGSIIHATNNEQDIRKMGGLQKSMPITTSCMTLGNLALAGTPFLAGFYTKDTIIETMCTSALNTWVLYLTILATALTAAYSLRMTYFTQLATPRHQPATHLTESDPNQTRPIIRLALGSIATGLVVTTIVLPTKPHHMTMPPLMKLSALLLTILGLICALDLMAHYSMKLTTTTKPHTTLVELGFYNRILHRALPHQNFTAALLSLQLMDQIWLKSSMPHTTKYLNLITTKKLSTSLTGNIKTHLLTFLMTSSLLVLMV